MFDDSATEMYFCQMQLRIQNLLPLYFDEKNSTASELWSRDITFEPGELVKIVAPSGSGKTSLIHFLYGLRKNYSGTITYADKNFSNFTIEEAAALRAKELSVVFQDMRLFPEQTARENLLIKLQLNPYHQPEKINEMAARLGIAGKLDSLCGTCSYGEQQRIAIIRALLQPYKILLLDEPFSHLDNANAEKAMELMLEESKARKATIIFADLERINFYPYTRLLHL